MTPETNDTNKTNRPSKTTTTHPSFFRAAMAAALALMIAGGGAAVFGPAAAQVGGLPTAVACVGPFGLPTEDDPVRLWDYGDAPDSAANDTGLSYPTLYSAGGTPFGHFPTTSDTTHSMWPGQPGARHRVVDVAWLGDVNLYGLGADFDPLHPADLPPTVERDADAFPDDDVTTTNLDPNTATPDHDGRDDGLAPGTLAAHTVDHLTFRVSTTPGIERWYVNALVDWNFDGRWAGTDANGAPEWALRNHVVSVAPLTSQLFMPAIDVGSTPGMPWVRLTLTPVPIVTEGEGMEWDGSVPPGYTDTYGQAAFPCGETEDHCGPIQVFDREGAGREAIHCEDEGDQPPAPVRCGGPGELTVASYDIDISTGFDNAAGQQMAVYGEDDDWRLAHHPIQGDGDWPLYALAAHPAWQQPAHGQWLNPFGDQYYGVLPGWPTDFENNWWGAPHGDYTYRSTFTVNDPNAVAVSMAFDWWRDGDTFNPSTVRYQEDTPSNWVGISTGVGYAPASGTPAAFTDLTPQSAYTFEVDVRNDITFTGLLVEGKMTVHCVGYDTPDPNIAWAHQLVRDVLLGP